MSLVHSRLFPAGFKKWAWLAALLFCPLIILAQYSYTTANGQLTITGYSGSGGIVTIPSVINGLPVTGIGIEAFYLRLNLTNITIPASVTNVGVDLFDSCLNLTNITVDPSNPVYASAGGVLFNKSKTLLLEFPPGLAGPYTFPASVTAIGDEAFTTADSLTNLSVPNGVTNIGQFAFSPCSRLANVSLGAGLISIADSAFIACSQLTNITVDASNPNFSSTGGVLFNKNKSALLLCPQALTGAYSIPGSVVLIATNAFSATSLSGITIPNGVASIGDYAFDFGENLTGMTFPNSVTNCGQGIFENCFHLEGVVLSTNQASIGFAAFDDCYALTNVTIPNSVTSIGDAAFSSCHALSSPVLPNNLTNIGAAFFDCTSFTNVMIPAKVIFISPNPFNNCTNLTNITVDPANAEYASASGVLFDKNKTQLLQYPVGLAGSYTVPNTVTYIDNFVFQSAARLTNVTISASVQTIGDNSGFGDAAFGGCVNLQGVYFLGNAAALGQSDVFENDTKAKVYYFSGTTGWSTTYGGLLTVMLQAPTSPPLLTNIGVQNGQFGFTFSGSNGQVIVVETSTNLVNWQPISTNTLTGTSTNITDANWKTFRHRFYRIRVP